MKCREKWAQSFSLARPIFQTFFCRAYRNKLFLFYSSLNKLFIFQFLLNNLFLAKKKNIPSCSLQYCKVLHWHNIQNTSVYRYSFTFQAKQIHEQRSAQRVPWLHPEMKVPAGAWCWAWNTETYSGYCGQWCQRSERLLICLCQATGGKGRTCSCLELKYSLWSLSGIQFLHHDVHVSQKCSTCTHGTVN